MGKLSKLACSFKADCSLICLKISYKLAKHQSWRKNLLFLNIFPTLYSEPNTYDMDIFHT